VRRFVFLSLGLLLLPSVLAAGLGLWSPAAAWQEHLGLELLLQLLLALEESALHSRLVGDGLVGVLEVSLILGSVAAILASLRFWEPRLPGPLKGAIAVPESGPAFVGLVVAAGVIAVAAASARPLFWACVVSGLTLRHYFLRQGNLPPRSPWTAPENRRRRIVCGVLATALSYYGVTSLWEGATYHNPVFALGELWADSLGRHPLLAGSSWGLAGLAAGAALLAWGSRGLRPRGDRYLAAGGAVTLLLLVASVVLEPLLERRWAVLLAGPGLVLLSAGLGAVSARWSPGSATDWAALDPRRVFAATLPLLFGAAAVLLCCLTLSLWTPLGTLPEGVEKISDADCVFSLGVDTHDRIFFTDRCSVSAGMVDSSGTEVWPLTPGAAEAVEELGGPDESGTFWAAIQAYALEAELVLLAIEGPAGPRSIDPQLLSKERAEGLGLIDEIGSSLLQTPADRAVARDPGGRLLPAQALLPDCWLSSWIPLPGDRGGEVLLGCENRSGGLIFDTRSRRISREVSLTSRLESGAFSPQGDRLFAVSLWSDPYVHAFSWPGGEETARSAVGPFNWDIVTVPGEAGYRLWLPRFIEGVMLVLDPETLATEAQIPLSFGIRAVHYEPVYRRVWAAASYSGELWSIRTSPPYDRQVFPLCGQTRDLVSDSRGGVIASTDCGIFRFDSAILLGAGG